MGLATGRQDSCLREAAHVIGLWGVFRYGRRINRLQKKGNSAFLAISPGNSSAFLQQECIHGPSPAALLADPILLVPWQSAQLQVPGRDRSTAPNSSAAAVKRTEASHSNTSIQQFLLSVKGNILHQEHAKDPSQVSMATLQGDPLSAIGSGPRVHPRQTAQVAFAAFALLGVVCSHFSTSTQAEASGTAGTHGQEVSAGY